ncbi:MAG: PhnD/SsuA/transferrin family substrate-binding protein [Casimicrobiaceae bacterium]
MGRRAWAQSRAPLEIGVLPNISARTLLAQYQPMRDYLVRTLRQPVQVSTAPSWAAFHQRVVARDYDIVVTASHLARLAQLDCGYVPILVFTPDIKGMIAFATSRPIKSIAELRGHTLVLSNPQSLVALRGLQWLDDSGLQRGRDFNTINTRADDSVGNVLVRGDAIAAMLSGGELRAIPAPARDQIQVLATFVEVPGFVVLASPLLPAADALAIKALLLAFATGSELGKAFMASTGFDGIRDLPRELMESMDAFVEPTRRLLMSSS